MTLTCCMTCGASVVDAYACMAAKVPSERAWNKSCDGSVVSAPRLSGRAGSACDVQAVHEELALAGRDDGLRVRNHGRCRHTRLFTTQAFFTSRA